MLISMNWKPVWKVHSQKKRIVTISNDHIIVKHINVLVPGLTILSNSNVHYMLHQLDCYWLLFFFWLFTLHRGHSHLRIQESAGRRKTQSQVGRRQRGAEKININQTRMGLYLHYIYYKCSYGMEDNRLDVH